MKMLDLRVSFASVLFLAVVPFVQADTLPPREDTRIEYLLSAVANLQAATSIRNGTGYGVTADPLRLKLNKGGAAVKSAEDFVRLCGSQSSMSGKA
jgi:hypothetical protein